MECRYNKVRRYAHKWFHNTPINHLKIWHLCTWHRYTKFNLANTTSILHKIMQNFHLMQISSIPPTHLPPSIAVIVSFHQPFCFHFRPTVSAAPIEERRLIGARAINTSLLFLLQFSFCTSHLLYSPHYYRVCIPLIAVGGVTLVRLVGGNKHVVRAKRWCHSRFIPHKIVNCTSNIDLWAYL